MGVKKSSRVVLRDDMIFTGYSSNGYAIPLDADKAVGGHSAGVSPMELMMTSLAGCTGMDVISILRKKKQDVVEFEVLVEGIRGDQHPKVYTNISVKFIVKGRGIDPKAVERAIDLSRDKYCGASATLKLTADIVYDYEIIEVDDTGEEA